MARGKSLLWGFIIGSTIAGATALLTTPKAGRDIRKDCFEGVEKVQGFVADLYQDGTSLSNQIKYTVQEGSNVIKDVSKDIRASVHEWKQEIEPHNQNIQSELENIKQSIEDLENLTSSRKSN